MQLEPWKVLASRTRFAAPPWLEVRQEQIQLPTGAIVDDYYVVQLRDWTIVVAFDQNDLVITERHYKHALRAIGRCLPAGYLNDGEDPLEGVQRELHEETGYVSDNWQSLGRFAGDGNRHCGIGHFFLARDCRPVVEPNSGDLEEMQIELLPFADLLSEFQTAIEAGELLEMGTITALGLARLALDRLPRPKDISSE